uniref:Uncharacterized protein n=1 Tax=Arundo donax TaxID=35708 RepID=A0A0A8ZHL4_ARUDO
MLGELNEFADVDA